MDDRGLKGDSYHTELEGKGQRKKRARTVTPGIYACTCKWRNSKEEEQTVISGIPLQSHWGASKWARSLC